MNQGLTFYPLLTDEDGPLSLTYIKHLQCADLDAKNHTLVKSL